MSNTKKKNNVRTGGAALTPSTKDIEFINTGHAAQSRYLAALANPFASPAVPIPDSFLTAHVCKLGKEVTLTGVTTLWLKLEKLADEATGDYYLAVGDQNGAIVHYTSEIGSRLVAAGIAFEDVGQADSIMGTVTYRQINSACATGVPYEEVSRTERMERNKGFGSILYELARRQALDFEGNARSQIQITFSAPIDMIARFSAIVETDGEQGFVETRTSNSDFLLTSSYPNHHAGVFADTPMPDLDHSLLTPSHTDVADHNPGHHSSALAGAAHWVASSAGWLWNHRNAVANMVSKAPSYYQAMVNYGGSFVRAGGQIMAIGSRAAPLAIAM